MIDPGFPHAAPAQDPDNGLLCMRRALQSADGTDLTASLTCCSQVQGMLTSELLRGAIHSDPSDVGLFVDILNEARAFACKAGGGCPPPPPPPASCCLEKPGKS